MSSVNVSCERRAVCLCLVGERDIGYEFGAIVHGVRIERPMSLGFRLPLHFPSVYVIHTKDGL